MDIQELEDLKKDRAFYLLAACGLLFVHWIHQALVLSHQEIFPVDIVHFLMGFNSLLFVALTVWFGLRAGLTTARIVLLSVLAVIPFLGILSAGMMAWQTRRVEHLVRS